MATHFPEIKAGMDATLRDLRRRTRDAKLARYDRNVVLPRVLLVNFYDRDEARRVCLTPRPVILDALRRNMQRHGELCRKRDENGRTLWYADYSKLVDARFAYLAERVAARRDRDTASQRLRVVRAA